MSTAVTGSSARCRALVPRMIASVLSGFRDNPLFYMFYAPFVRMFNVFMCSFGLLAFRAFLCLFHVSACKHVRLTCAQ